MHTWYWRNWQGMTYLSCSLLEAWPHGFFTQEFWPRSPQELTAVLHPNATGYRLKQVHGNTVLTPSEISNHLSKTGPQEEEDPALAAGDGLITEKPLQAVWVATADCTPVLIGDRKTGRVAALHAGWRGTAAKIVPQAIARLQAQGSNIQDLRIAMGPAIAGEVYQVSLQVAAQLGASIIPHEEETVIIKALQELPTSPLLPDPDPERIRIDVRQVNVLQMEKMGISLEQIAIAPYCTYQTPEHFFSYRRDNLKKVQWSGIVSINPGS